MKNNTSSKEKKKGEVFVSSWRWETLQEVFEDKNPIAFLQRRLLLTKREGDPIACTDITLWMCAWSTLSGDLDKAREFLNDAEFIVVQSGLRSTIAQDFLSLEKLRWFSQQGILSSVENYLVKVDGVQDDAVRAILWERVTLLEQGYPIEELRERLCR